MDLISQGGGTVTSHLSGFLTLTLIAPAVALAQSPEAGSDTAEGATSDEAEEEERLPWRGSVFLWENQASTTTFDGGSSTLSYNPYVAMAFTIAPRWYVTEHVSLRLRQGLTVELTDADSGVRNREPLLADTVLDLVHDELYELEGVILSAGARLSLPTSIASRAYEKYFGIGPVIGLTRAFEDVLEGFVAGVSGGYSYTFAGSNVPLVDATRADYPQLHACTSPSVECFDAGDAGAPQASGMSTVGHAFTVGLRASVSPIEKLSVDASFGWAWGQGRELADGCVETLGGPVCTTDESDTHLRLVTRFTFGVGYALVDWLALALSYDHLTSELNRDGSRRNPFWSTDSAVTLAASVTLDELYLALTDDSSTSATEIVRDDTEHHESAATLATHRPSY